MIGTEEKPVTSQGLAAPVVEEFFRS